MLDRSQCPARPFPGPPARPALVSAFYSTTLPWASQSVREASFPLPPSWGRDSLSLGRTPAACALVNTVGADLLKRWFSGAEGFGMDVTELPFNRHIGLEPAAED